MDSIFIFSIRDGFMWPLHRWGRNEDTSPWHDRHLEVSILTQSFLEFPAGVQQLFFNAAKAHQCNLSGWSQSCSLGWFPVHAAVAVFKYQLMQPTNVKYYLKLDKLWFSLPLKCNFKLFFFIYSVHSLIYLVCFSIWPVGAHSCPQVLKLLTTYILSISDFWGLALSQNVTVCSQGRN